MQDIKEREFRDSGSITNTEICFELRATTLRPHLHTEGFPLYPHRTSHTGNLHWGFTITNLGVHNSSLQQQPPLHKRQDTKPKQQSPLHKTDRDKAKQWSPLYKRDKALSQHSNDNHLFTRGITTNPNHNLNHLYTRGMITNPKHNLLYT